MKHTNGYYVAIHASLPTNRTLPAAVSYKNFLIVAGGVPSDKLQSTTAVEVLDTDSGNWYRAPPMPYNGHHISPVIVGQHLYLHLRLRGSITLSKFILKVFLPILISHTLAGKNHNLGEATRCVVL